MSKVSRYWKYKRKAPISAGFLNRVKDAILGTSYELGVIFASSSKIRELNSKYRHKNESTDILSFPIGKRKGEIYISMAEVKRRAPLFGRTDADYPRFLVIHGLLHLKGFKHGSKMEHEERKFQKKFRIQSR